MNNNIIIIKQPSINDAKQIGELLFLVDPYIYPPFFNTQENTANIMPLLMEEENSIFAPKHILIAQTNNIISGLLIAYTNPIKNPTMMIDFYHKYSSLLPETALHVCKNYFTPVCTNLKPNETYIMSIATHPDYRKQGIATTLITKTKENNPHNPIILDTLLNNHTAIKTYQTNGFVKNPVIEQGYAYHQPAPETIKMVYYPKPK